MLRNQKSFNPSEIEEKVLSLWKEKNIFQKSLVPKKGKKAMPTGRQARTFNFWEGPPTANGRPGMHHVIARSFKDVILRFKTMTGFVVPRKGGWDTHGLPVEIQVEKELGLSTKKDIEKYGIAAFNQKCKESVWTYKTEWEKFTERIGYWLDLKDAYVTYTNDYVESLWWIIKQFWNKDLMYQGYKIVNWCPRCGTSLSSHEIAQGYKEVTENSVFMKFKLKKGQKIGKFSTDDVFILSWTTTPWTLPGNIALAIGERINYSLIQIDTEENKEKYIIASELISQVLKNWPYKELGNFSGKDLIGLSYEPLFKINKMESDKSYKIYPAGFVTTTDGTGVVHTAVVYGEDDYQLGKKIGLPEIHTVDESGHFIKEVPGLSGMYVKAKETEEKIFEHLRKNNNFVYSLPYTHEYPFCWRCDTPLLYYARSSWFVAVNKVRKNLIKNNEGINWVPEHIKEGRFGEWLKEEKDWNFSRERFWGTPLPIWNCENCGHQTAIGGFEDINNLKPTHNKYFLLRHGEANANKEGWIASGENGKFVSELTDKGKKEVEDAAKKLKKEKIDLIFASSYKRTKETAQIISKETGAKVVFDDRLEEINTGIYNHKKIEEFSKIFGSIEEKFEKVPEGGESRNQVRQRIFEFIKEVDKKYDGKNILIVSHGDPLWMLEAAIAHSSYEEALKLSYPKFAKPMKIELDNLPCDSLGNIDVHRPFIDEVKLKCEKCGKTMKRIPEVVDVWFDSGSMPFAQSHFPFNPKQKGDALKNIGKNIIYPADYISEAVDQTRGWFYTLLAVSTLLGLDTPYKNVICLGHIRDKFGQKMSKSKGNVVDPWAMIDKYGADAVRWYLYTINAPGEPKNFDEEELAKALRRMFLVVYNSFVFLQTYGKDKLNIDKVPTLKEVLDKWIISRFNQLSLEVEKKMNDYDVYGSTQVIEKFVDDLSRWYIRRSRRRLQKPENQKDWENVSAILAYVILNLSKVIAPFTPFFSESLYQSFKKSYKFNSEDSIHLEDWPAASKIKDEGLIEGMEEIRNLASLVLAKRAELGIKVRQPLARLKVKSVKSKSGMQEELFEILKDEINVKEVIVDGDLKEEFELDTEITPELKREGQLREFTRMIQDLRQEAGCVPKDKIYIWIDGSSEIKAFIETNKDLLAKEVGAKKVEIGRPQKFDAESEAKMDNQKIWLSIKKA